MRLCILSILSWTNFLLFAQDVKDKILIQGADSTKYHLSKKSKPLFGIASYYADKFNGRKTANGDIYSHSKMTAACNVLPLGTWIRVTNLKNNKSVIVRTNDRLHVRMKRIVDLSKSAATKLGYVRSGLTKVKVEVLGKKK